MPEDNIEERMQRMAKVAEEFDAETFEELLDKTKDENEEVRLIAAARMGNLEDPRAVPVLIGLLDDPVSRVRGTAALRLGPLKAEQSREKLIERLKNDEAGTVRAMCVRSLGEIGGADEEIIGALDDPDWHAKICAITTLGWKGVSSATEKIAQLLDDPGYNVRYFASVALMELGAVTPQVIAALESLREMPEALEMLKTFAETDVMVNALEKYADDIEAFGDDDDFTDPADYLRRRYGENEVPFPPEDPLGDLILKARGMLGDSNST